MTILCLAASCRFCAASVPEASVNRLRPSDLVTGPRLAGRAFTNGPAVSPPGLSGANWHHHSLKGLAACDGSAAGFFSKSADKRLRAASGAGTADEAGLLNGFALAAVIAAKTNSADRYET